MTKKNQFFLVDAEKIDHGINLTANQTLELKLTLDQFERCFSVFVKYDIKMHTGYKEDENVRASTQTYPI